jgi:hypothetical protein
MPQPWNETEVSVSSTYMQRDVVYKHSTCRDVCHKIVLQLLVLAKEVSCEWLRLGVDEIDAVFDLFNLKNTYPKQHKTLRHSCIVGDLNRYIITGNGPRVRTITDRYDRKVGAKYFPSHKWGIKRNI